MKSQNRMIYTRFISTDELLIELVNVKEKVSMIDLDLMIDIDYIETYFNLNIVDFVYSDTLILPGIHVPLKPKDAAIENMMFEPLNFAHNDLICKINLPSVEVGIIKYSDERIDVNKIHCNSYKDHLCKKTTSNKKNI